MEVGADDEGVGVDKHSVGATDHILIELVIDNYRQSDGFHRVEPVAPIQ